MKLCCNCGKTFDHASWRCSSCSYERKRIGGHFAFAPELADKSEGFDASYFRTLAELEPGSFWFRSRNRLLCWTVEHYFPKAENFLEFGCGTGFVLGGISKELRQLSLAGGEVSSAEMQFLGLGVCNQERVVQKHLRAFGIKDLYEAFHQRNDVFLICNERRKRLLVQYIQEHYYSEVVVKSVFKGKTFTVYKVIKGS